jgi:predicted RNase H-like HicB family nuclease
MSVPPAFDVYLEIGAEGECLAHVLELPGCVLRTASEETAQARLPATIHDHLAWLRRHGEVVDDPPEPITIQIRDTSHGFGPFRRGDRAALFPPDHRPLSRAELEHHLRLATHTRADLLASLTSVEDEVLDWQPTPDEMSVRAILRHVGNTEQWYVSRLVPPETLPPEWADDDQLPLFPFLDMERRTALERLRRLTDDELAATFYPTHWTDHPHEPWTARKALRRLLEHEREHTAHIAQVLAAYDARASNTTPS